MESEDVMPELNRLSATDMLKGYATGEISPRDVCAAVLYHVERVNPTLNAFVSVMGDRAMTDAVSAEKKWCKLRQRGDEGDAPLLLGVPLSIKDTIDMKGVPTTMGSLATSSEPIKRDELCLL